MYLWHNFKEGPISSFFFVKLLTVKQINKCGVKHTLPDGGNKIVNCSKFGDPNFRHWYYLVEMTYKQT